jgi:SAM-dependent methyltransferase
MGNEFNGQAAHSAEHFGDTRDHWWNLDFLQLMAKRWRLDVVRDVLDVGCGVGHWGMLLASVMADDVRVTGIDYEPTWVEEANARALARGLAGRFSYRQGEAQRLPFPDDSFDLTTCQTVLIHLADPSAAIAEMLRVTRPGGLVAVAEPNNVSESLLLDSISSQADTDDIVELVRFQLTCERGKVALGEGDSSLGDRVPGLFVAQGLSGVEVHLNDKAIAVFPPYASSAQRAFTEDARDRVARRLWNYSEVDARRLFLAGGGTETDFGNHFARGLAPRDDRWTVLPRCGKKARRPRLVRRALRRVLDPVRKMRDAGCVHDSHEFQLDAVGLASRSRFPR